MVIILFDQMIVYGALGKMIDFVIVPQTRPDHIETFGETTQEMDHVKVHQTVRYIANVKVCILYVCF